MHRVYIEDTILKLLFQSTGNILDDENSLRHWMSQRYVHLMPQSIRSLHVPPSIFLLPSSFHYPLCPSTSSYHSLLPTLHPSTSPKATSAQISKHLQRHNRQNSRSQPQGKKQGRKVATWGSVTYFLVDKLAKVDPMYQYWIPSSTHCWRTPLASSIPM